MRTTLSALTLALGLLAAQNALAGDTLTSALGGGVGGALGNVVAPVQH